MAECTEGVILREDAIKRAPHCDDEVTRRTEVRETRQKRAMSLESEMEILKDAKLFRWRPVGVLDETKTNQIVAFLTEQETKFGREFNRFTDMFHLDAVDLNFKFVFQVALYRRLARLGRAPIKSAFFVPNDAVARYVKLHALVTDQSPLKVKIFKDHESAAKWLDVSADLLQAET